MLAFFEDLSKLSHLILLFCSFLFYRTLKKAKRERKLTVFPYASYPIRCFFLGCLICNAENILGRAA